MPRARLELGEQREDARGDGDVERGGRLVGDDEGRLAGDRHGDRDALALATGELVRIGAGAPRRLGNAYLVEQRHGAIPRHAAREAAPMPQHRGDLRAHIEQRVERRLRLLEDDRDGLAANAIERGAVEREQVAPLEQHAAAHVGAGR